jgi:hypothetical protein
VKADEREAVVANKSDIMTISADEPMDEDQISISLDDDESRMLHANPYNALDNDNDSNWVDIKNKKRKRTSSITNTSTKPKNTKPPPLTLLNINITQIQNELRQLDLSENFNLKLTGEGTKVFTSNTSDYIKVKNSFISNKRNFFSHQMKEEQLAKFVLSGLHKMPVTDVFEALTEAGKTPKLVKQMQIKREKHNNHALYIVYFLKSSKTKLADLQQIRVVNYMRVRWSHFQNKRTGPTQCSKCLRFGHGTQNCFAEARCIRCAQQHASKDCHLIAGQTDKTHKVDEALLNCVHCGEHHTANFSGCRKRIEFVKARQAASQNARPTQKRPQQATFAPAPQLSHANFPSISSSSTQAWSQASHHSHRNLQPPPLSSSRPPPQQQQQNNATNGNSANVNATNGLLDASQLISIFQEITSIVLTATTVQDQINALCQIALKYLAPKHV